MIVYKIDHCEVYSKERADFDSIANILRQTNIELEKIEKKNKDLIKFELSDIWLLLSLPSIAVTGLKRVYEYCKLILDKSELYKTCFDKINKAILEVRCITLKDAQLSYPNTKNLAVGYYTLHPVDNKSLVVLNNYHQEIYKDKDDEIVYLLSRMGAKRIRILTSDSNSHKHNHETNFNASQGDNLNLRGELNSSHKSSINSMNERIVEYDGCVTDIDVHLLNNSAWFKNDGQMTSIFKSRIVTDNRLKSYCYKSIYDNQFSFNFGIAAKLLAIENNLDETKIEAKLKFEFDKLKSKVRYFEVEFH